MPQERKPNTFPIYYYIKELTSTYTHISIYYPIYRGHKRVYHPTLIFIGTYAHNSFRGERCVSVFMCVVANLFLTFKIKGCVLLCLLICLFSYNESRSKYVCSYL